MTETALRPPTRDDSTMAPVPYRVRSRVQENADSVTLCLEPVAAGVAAPAPGEFNMLYAFGIGEVAISVSGDASDGILTHTIRSVGAVSAALCAAEPGSTLGVRGPFGTSWGVAEAAGRDLVIVAGGSFDISGPSCAEGAWSESFLSAKRDFYRGLPLNSAIESTAAEFSSAHPDGYLGLHLRYSDRAHQAPTPWAIKRALARQAAETGLTDVFIASDSPRARAEWSRRVEGMGLRAWNLSDSFAALASATSAGPALGDWRILGGSTRLVFFAESSYSVEACVASGSWASSSALPTSRARAVGHRALSHLRAAVTYPARNLMRR